MKKLFSHIKSFVDIWKVWIFFAAMLVSTNGAQMYANSGPVEQAATVSAPQEATIIYKPDNSYCDDLMSKHENGSRH